MALIASPVTVLITRATCPNCGSFEMLLALSFEDARRFPAAAQHYVAGCAERWLIETTPISDFEVE